MVTVDLPTHIDRVKNIFSNPGRMFIDGEWVESHSGATLTTYDPGSGQAVLDVPHGTDEDVDRAVQAAREAFRTWRRTTPLERAGVLWRIADILEKNREELAFLETLDTGKPLDHSRNYDLSSAINEFRYMSGLAARVTGRVQPLATQPGGVFHTYTTREPLGVIGAIIPWNFPLANAAWKIAPALAAGNTVVVKPSEETPLTTLRAAELMVEAGVPAGVVNVVTGDGSTGRALVRHAGVDKITFTGSTATGQQIVRESADQMTRLSLELGGKSPNVVFADADLDAAILGAVGGSFWDSGEVCSAGSRLYVERPVVEQFLAGLQRTVEAMPIEHGLHPDAAIGPLISAKHLERVAGYVDIGRGEGAEVAFGGQIVERDGNFYQPTVLLGAAPESRVINEEIFGPVVTVVPFDDMDEVLAAANSSSYGLAAGVWTRDMAKAHHFTDNVQSGIVWVNTYGLVDPAMPWGGFKKSGWGRENGEEALAEFTETKAVYMNVAMP